MRDAMIAGISLNIFNNHADRVKNGQSCTNRKCFAGRCAYQEEKVILTPLIM
jgi:alpha-N-arabinofuranosidase